MTETEPKNRRLGYARVSTHGQTLAAQLEQLKAEGCAKIHREKASRAKPDRKELLRMLDHLAPGDLMTVTRIVTGLPARLLTFSLSSSGSLTPPGNSDHWPSHGRHRHQHGPVDDRCSWGVADVERDLIRTRIAEGRAVLRIEGSTCANCRNSLRSSREKHGWGGGRRNAQ
jgi:hypothetical protein